MKSRFSFFTSTRQGPLAERTLLGRSLLPLIAAAIVGLSAVLALPNLLAQEDLSVPGLTDDTPATAQTPVQVSADGTVTHEDTTLFGLIAKGGWAMWVLGAFSFAVVGLGIYCAVDLRKQNFCADRLQATLRESWSTGNLDGINEAVRGDPTTLARMMASVSEYIEETGYSTDDNEILRGLLAEAGQKTNRSRAKIVNYFSVIAQASPMMGLLGTVSGMIKAFGALGKTGMAKPEELAGHISEALVTTATGLIIALPAIFLYFFFRDRIEELILECEDFGTDMLNILRRTAYAAADELSEESFPGEALASEAVGDAEPDGDGDS